jgi:hypothetical protein
MKASTIQEIKQELLLLSTPKLTDLCLRLARFKKENKELLAYLLFEADDEQGYIDGVKKQVDEQFSEITNTNLYFIKKSLRKILRVTNKYIRYTGSKQAEVELLLYFCIKVKESGIPFGKSPALVNLYYGQVKKIRKTLESLHEDLQYDYLREVDKL